MLKSTDYVLKRESIIQPGRLRAFYVDLNAEPQSMRAFVRVECCFQGGFNVSGTKLCSWPGDIAFSYCAITMVHPLPPSRKRGEQTVNGARMFYSKYSYHNPALSVKACS